MHPHGGYGWCSAFLTPPLNLSSRYHRFASSPFSAPYSQNGTGTTVYRGTLLIRNTRPPRITIGPKAVGSYGGGGGSYERGNPVAQLPQLPLQQCAPTRRAAIPG